VVADFDKVDFSKSIYPLVSTIIKKDLKARRKISPINVIKDLTGEARKIRKQIKKHKKNNIEWEYPLDE
jgi:hypothetical protein